MKKLLLVILSLIVVSCSEDTTSPNNATNYYIKSVSDQNKFIPLSLSNKWYYTKTIKYFDNTYLSKENIISKFEKYKNELIITYDAQFENYNYQYENLIENYDGKEINLFDNYLKDTTITINNVKFDCNMFILKTWTTQYYCFARGYGLIYSADYDAVSKRTMILDSCKLF